VTLKDDTDAAVALEVFRFQQACIREARDAQREAKGGVGGFGSRREASKPPFVPLLPPATSPQGGGGNGGCKQKKPYNSVALVDAASFGSLAGEGEKGLGVGTSPQRPAAHNSRGGEGGRGRKGKATQKPLPMVAFRWGAGS
jgi:hypothetical protein